MKHIKGFVLIGRFLGPRGFYEMLYGESINNLPRKFESLIFNGLKPFGQKQKALAAKVGLKKFSDLEKISLGWIEMTVAETEEEFYAFKGKKRLVVLKKDEMGIQLIGRYVEGKPNIYPLKGAFLSENDFKAFFGFEAALYAAREVNRQAQCGAALATFQLKRL
ncbi:MAG: hypothetical protein Q8R12_05110 [bacterium]|nr:hypothetical protein [bacterium]